jgi:hypothetical protein
MPSAFVPLSADEVCTILAGFMDVLGLVRILTGHGEAWINYLRMSDHVLTRSSVSNHYQRRVLKNQFTMYNTPALCNLVTTCGGGRPTADTTSFAPLSMMISISSSRWPLV